MKCRNLSVPSLLNTPDVPIKNNLFQQKLAELDPHQQFPRQRIRSFLDKFQPPESTRDMFNGEQLKRVGFVDSINTSTYIRALQSNADYTH